MVDRRRQVGAGQQATLLTHLDGNGTRTDAAEDLTRQRIRHHARRRGIQHERRGIRRRQTIIQPVHSEIGDRRHVDENFGDQDKRDRQQQQFSGQAKAPPQRQARGPGPELLDSLRHDLSFTCLPATVGPNRVRTNC